MPAYVIVEIDVRDSVRYEDYKAMSTRSVPLHDGRFVVRGGAVETLEGDWEPKRIVVLEFPSADKAREWWNSDDYAPAKALRQETATTRMILVEGV